MTRIQDPYEEPLAPDITINTENSIPEEYVERLMRELQELGHLVESKESYYFKSKFESGQP